MSIAENLGRVHERICKAAQVAGRNASAITLMAVTKTHPPELICEAYAACLRVFGENRVQEFAGKSDAVAGLLDAEFHLIRHLQTNKAARAAELCSSVDSVDSVRLAQRLDDAAARLERRMAVLIEINVGDERQKSGVAPCSRELEDLLQAAPRLEH